MKRPGTSPARMKALPARVAERKAASAAAWPAAGGDAFLARLTHDLAAPLTALGGFLELLARGGAGPLARPQGALLARARGACERLRSVVERTSAWSRLRRGMLDPDPAPCDLAGLLRAAAAARGERVRFEGAGGPVTATTDARLVGLIVREYLDNALRMSPRAAPVTLTLSREGGRARVSVRGGVPPPGHWRWPEAPPAAPVPGAGPGIGLPLVKGIAALIGGKVGWARKADGMRFSLTVARTRRSAGARKPATPGAAPIARQPP